VLAIDVGPQGSLSAWGNKRHGNGSTGERFFVDRLAAKRIRHLPAFLEALTELPTIRGRASSASKARSNEPMVRGIPDAPARRLERARPILIGKRRGS
jgi:hypothetical protein